MQQDFSHPVLDETGTGAGSVGEAGAREKRAFLCSTGPRIAWGFREPFHLGGDAPDPVSSGWGCACALGPRGRVLHPVPLFDVAPPVVQRGIGCGVEGAEQGFNGHFREGAGDSAPEVADGFIGAGGAFQGGGHLRE